jgi:large conductance mechanosensitive channel
MEFKEFAMRGNVTDLAIGIVIGAAFTKIVSSLVSDVITPLLGYLVGKVDFKFIKLGNIMVGNFLQSIIDFAIVALAIFALVKIMNSLKRKKEEAKTVPEAPKASKTDELLTEIRDIMVKDLIKTFKK